MTDWLELGADLPVVAHDGGFMDSGIRNWHDIFRMSNTMRRIMSNACRVQPALVLAWGQGRRGERPASSDSIGG